MYNIIKQSRQLVLMGQCAGSPKNSNKTNEPISPNPILRCEQKLLRLIFKDLAARSPDEVITIKTFETLFNANTLWSRSLFHKFAGEDSDTLSEEDFVKGVGFCLSLQSEEQKIRFLFELYDVDGKNKISYNEFLAILFSYPQQQMMNVLKQAAFVESLPSEKLLYLFAPDHKELNIEELDDCETNYTIPALNKYCSMESPETVYETLKLSPKKSEHHSLAKLTYSNNFYKTCIIKEYADYIFHRFRLSKKKQELEFQMFYEFIKNYPKLYNPFFQGFKEFLWRFDTVTKQYRFRRGAAIKQGSSWEIYDNKKKERLLIFVRPALLVFDTANLQFPIEIKNLEDLFVSPVESSQFGFGFYLKHEDHVYPQKIYSFQTKQEQNSWLKILHQFQRPDILRKYRIQKDIGYGSYSHVHQCQLKDTGFKYAVKIISKPPLSKQQRDLIDSQWRILTLCEHPNILKGVQKYEDDKQIYLVTELLSEGSLYQYVKSKEILTEREAWLIFKQLLEAITYIHSVGLIHRDLKLNNILVKSIEGGKIIPIIIDFGLAVQKIKVNSLDNNLKFAGTPGFVAPELYLHRDYDEKIDMFSLGVILYFLLSGKLPFHSIDPNQVRELTCKCQPNMQSPIWNRRSQAVKDLVGQMITWKNNRIDCEAAFKHQWVARMEETACKQTQTKICF